MDFNLESSLLQAVAGDYYELLIYITGANGAILKANNSTWFEVEVVR